MLENDHFIKIYKNQGGTYHQMISVEDVDQNIPSTIGSIVSLTGKNVLDLGSGTGRLPLVFPNANFTCLDLHENMCLENQKQMVIHKYSWDILQGDMRLIPFPNSSFDIVTAGWAIGHLTGWYTKTWQTEINCVLDEIHRVIKPNGHIIILETLSTGSTIPSPPNKNLANYYSLLTGLWGFKEHQIQTDYLFPSLDDALHYSEFFFGKELAKKVLENNWIRLPEWTGIWHKQLP